MRTTEHQTSLLSDPTGSLTPGKTPDDRPR